MDFQPEWLDANALGGGLSEMAKNSGVLRMVYEASFAFEDGNPAKPNFAAGSAIRVMLRLLFDYRGYCFYKMKRGTAETLATPLYQALVKRRVRFEFFHRVDEITLTADGGNVAAVTFAVQSKANAGSYDPFVHTDCWPDRPKYDLLENGGELQQSDELEGGGYDLEDPRIDAARTIRSSHDPLARRRAERGGRLRRRGPGNPTRRVETRVPGTHPIAERWHPMARHVRGGGQHADAIVAALARRDGPADGMAPERGGSRPHRLLRAAVRQLGRLQRDAHP